MVLKHQTITIDYVYQACTCGEADCEGCDDAHPDPQDIDWGSAYDSEGGDYARWKILSKTPVTIEETE